MGLGPYPRVSLQSARELAETTGQGETSCTRVLIARTPETRVLELEDPARAGTVPTNHAITDACPDAICSLVQLDRRVGGRRLTMGFALDRVIGLAQIMFATT